ncbi:MAG: MucB/RseB C-terminal domain-containing protein [Cellvibrionaceae bacterium]
MTPFVFLMVSKRKQTTFRASRDNTLEALSHVVITAVPMMGTIIKKLFMLACVVFSASVFAVDQPHGLLEQMAQAARELNYTGSFSYEQGGGMETFRITHRVDQGREFERLEHLSGPQRAVERSGRTTDCIEPGERILRGLNVSTSPAQLKNSYRFHFAGKGRVAGREVVQLDVLAKDEFRHSYRLSIDAQTKLLLRSLRVDRKKRVLERFQFVDIRFGEDEVASPVNIKKLTGKKVTIHQAPLKVGSCHGEDIKSTHWFVSWLPQGFALSGQRLSKKHGDMLTFSDGLANFTVFIEPYNKQAFVQGHAQHGATAAFATRLELDDRDIVVSVVGDISAVAAKQIAQSVTTIQ